MTGDAIMELMVIEVHGVPDILPHGQMTDKLKIHFQKRSNHGDDVLLVLYPTSIQRKAYVIFESAEVLGVLKHPHVLELDDGCYPLHVKKAHVSEIDMKAETTLNVNKFQRPADALQLVDSYGFKVTKLSHDHFLLTGSFLSLKLLHSRLIQLLVQDIQPHSRSSSALPSHDTSGHVSQTALNSLEYNTLPRSTSKYGDVIENSIDVGSNFRSSMSSPSNLPIPKPTSLLSGHSGSHASPRRSSSSFDDSMANSTYSSSQYSSCGPYKVSFPVDTDILNYALTHRQSSLNDIEKTCHTEMRLKDEVGFTTVTFWGKNCKKAETRLMDVIQQLTSSLRTQEIQLSKYGPEQQAQICERIQQSKDLNWDVQVRHDGNVVKVVGSSVKSFEVMQMLLGWDNHHQEHGHRGRNMERNSALRRSSSLPRQYKLSGFRVTEQGRSDVSERQSNVTKEYSPSHYEDEPQSSSGGSRPSPRDQASRNRSKSEIRSKNMATRGQLQQNDKVLPSSGETKLAKVPSVIKQLGGIPSRNEIRQKLQKK
ncbi:RNA-binding protein 43 isoform X3 [Brachyhypopomus gauderio]|uniref:RNA-binding protein 43 isoform X3 n=1 Tax=Brachyhypopomus gauderio TaxID=698409 RepID=UPI0040432F5D